jgi:adenosylcobyric acid synthase
MRAIMVVGTSSHVGKSLITAAICRILARRGDRVTPFKGQNMALNAYVTADGGEIGHAQAVQAWAAKIEPRVEMNPILLKPQGDMTSQVIINGRAVGRAGADDYYRQYFDRGWQEIQASLSKLATEFDVVVCEGAGSPVEVNLKHRDLTNMRVAKHLNAKTFLVADIERGGVFAQIVGTLALLDEDERALIKGIIINKFRGQRSLLDPGLTWLEDYTGIPVLGVIPWLQESFPAEDSLGLLERAPQKKYPELTIAVLRLPRIANFTDFDPLDAEPTVNLKYVSPQEPLGHPDAVIIPGSKTTIADLATLTENGMANALHYYIQTGGVIFGICGGMQILGEAIDDPAGLEGKAGNYPGLGLLPGRTVITPGKITRQCQCTSLFPQAGLPITGYEIHQGRTHYPQNMNHHQLFDQPNLGIVNQELSVWGTYLHGLFDNGAWRRVWLNNLRNRRGLPSLPTAVPSYQEEREKTLDRLADVVAEHLDLSQFLS